LVWRNITGKLFRSGAILACAALVAGLSLSATLVVRGAERGLRQNLSRMGADLLIIPWGTMSQDFDGAHLVGLMTERWMPRTYMERVRAVEGVEAITPQLYLSTLIDSPYCSSSEMHLVAYDPSSDFVLKPWLEHDPIGNLRLGEAVGGAAVAGPDDGDTIQVYDYPLKLVRTLQESGGDVDQTLFVSFDTAMAMLEVLESQLRPPFEIAPGTISSAMVKVELGRDPHEVAMRILEQVPGVVPIESTGFFQTQRAQMVGLLRAVLVLAGLTWLLSTLFMGMVFSLAANEREREIGVLRALGATSTLVLQTLLLEGVALALSGGIAGLGLTVLATAYLQEPIARIAGIQIQLPSAPVLAGLVAAGLALAALSVTVAAWIPAARVSRQEPALAMRE
jgi:putative ABC transport system permease protein